jgi:RNA polymerase sigma factor (sigma-70 family)
VVKSVFRGEMERMEDLRLLRRYAEEGCAASFEAVVRRHIGWVYASSVRQVGDPELAEDVTQAVFVLLARRAGTIGDQTLLTGWLFNTVRFTAKEARRKEARRRKHESRAAVDAGAAAAAEAGIDEQAGEAMAPLLDEAVASLTESDRQAVLLRFYEGRDFAQVAEVLGTNEPAARKRVSRAVARLGRYFTKRGITLPVAVLAATLLARASEAAPLAVSAHVLTTVGAGPLPAVTGALLRGTALRMLQAKRRLAAAIVACMGLLGVGLWGVVIAWLVQTPPETVELPFENRAAEQPWGDRVGRPMLTDRLEVLAESARGQPTIDAPPKTPAAERAPRAEQPLARRRTRRPAATRPPQVTTRAPTRSIPQRACRAASPGRGEKTSSRATPRWAAGAGRRSRRQHRAAATRPRRSGLRPPGPAAGARPRSRRERGARGARARRSPRKPRTP